MDSSAVGFACTPLPSAWPGSGAKNGIWRWVVDDRVDEWDAALWGEAKRLGEEAYPGGSWSPFGKGQGLAYAHGYERAKTESMARTKVLEDALEALTREVWNHRPSGKRWAPGMPAYEAYHAARAVLAGRGEVIS